MTKLIVATTNPGKLREYRRLLSDLAFEVVGPNDLGLVLDVEETGTTFEENAVLKARAFSEATDLPALADDSGLEVDALGGFPGVRSSRWVAGGDPDRVRALLSRLEGIPHERRAARFRAVVALALPDGRIETAEGTVEGRIAEAPVGSGGFGYDPVFLVEDGGYSGALTMAQLPAEEKNRISHRGRALRALRATLSAIC